MALNDCYEFLRNLDKHFMRIVPPYHNTVSGQYSAILGGANNNDGGISFTGMYGNGLIASAFGVATSATVTGVVDNLCK